MPQAGVSERPRRARPVEPWIDWSEEDMWSAPTLRRRTGRPDGDREPPRRHLDDPGPIRASGGATSSGTVPAPRTVVIRGRGDDRATPSPYGSLRHRPPRAAYERPGYRPDRMALWAVVLGIVLILAAASSSRAAAPRGGHARPAPRVILAAVATQSVATFRR